MSPADLFLRPEALPVLALAPVAWLVLRALDRARARRLVEVVGPRAASLAATRSEGRRSAGRALAGAGLLLALASALDPAWGDAVPVESRGVDLVLCLDVSRSMLARDVAPDRLSRAQQEIRALAERAQGDRVGLVVFAGEARVLVPRTQDLRTLADLANGASPLSVARGGTDLGAALETALGVLEGADGEHEAIVLLTDGEDLSGRGLSVAQTCRERGIAVHAMGFGTALGSKVALEGEGGEAYLVDRAGREVVSAMDARSLRAIADATGGRFVDAAPGEHPLVGLYEDRILAMARKRLEAEGRRRRENRFQWPLLGAVALWILDLGLSDRRRR